MPLADVINEMTQVLPKGIECVEPELFQTRLNEMMNSDSERVTLLQPLLAYQSADGNIAFVGCTAEYTNGILFRLGFRWSPTSTDYIRNFIKAIAGLGYFDSAID